MNVQIIIIACYVTAALVIAVVPPLLPVAVPWSLSLLYGLVFAVGAGLIHDVMLRRQDSNRMTRRWSVLRKAYGQNREDLTRTRDEVRRIYEALESAGQFAAQPDTSSLQKVAAEVRVLHSLVDQLYSDQESDAEARQKIASPDVLPEERAAAAIQLSDATARKFRSYNALDEGVVLDIVREGLRRDRVDLYLQPIVSLPQRKQRYVECFSRIRAEDGTMLMPDQYIEPARISGLIRAIDNMLLFRCVQLLRRTEKYNYTMAYFCNVTPHTVGDREFFEEFIEYLENCGDLAPSLVFEFSQDDYDLLSGDVEEDLKRLSKAGYRFSLDQVRSLDLNISALAARDFQFVKIDAGLLLERARKAPQEVQALKKSLDDAAIDLIVEKIETEQALVELLDFRIDYGQGYLFGEPKLSKDPPEEFQELQVSQ